jgi:hypothetical protein
MIRLPQALAAVIGGTIASGVAGGIVGAAVGQIAPTFVAWLHSPVPGDPGPAFEPVEFGLGLGVVCGLILGAGASVFLVVVLVLRDAWLARAGFLPEVKAG